MKLTLTNTGTEPEPMADPRSDWSDVLTPGDAFELESEEADVLIIGDKPSVREQFERAAGDVKDFITKILGRKDRAREAGEADEQVSVSIANHGANGVRVVLGDGTTELAVNPGETKAVSAKGYLELRELGHAPQQGGTPD